MKKSSGCLIRLIICFVIFIGLSIWLAVWFSSLFVRGTTFSPDDFSIEEFSYIRANLFASKPNSKTLTNRSSFSQSLISSGLIKNRPVKVHHLAWDNVTDPLSRDMQAGILVNIILHEEEFWIDWNTGNPKLASVLWPIIQNMAYEELYVLTPGILKIAASHHQVSTDPVIFTAEIHRFIKSELEKMIEEQNQAGRDKIAGKYRLILTKYRNASGKKVLQTVK